MTTSKAAMIQRLLTALQPKVVVCEEAGEVLESHIAAALTPGTEHLIMIGDHQQLRPKVESYSLTAASGGPIGLDISMFERLACSHSGAVLTTLLTQRRMHPHISSILRNTLYPKLEDGANVLAHPPVRGMEHRVFFFDHNFSEGVRSADSDSKTNEFEASMIVEHVKYLVRQGYAPNEIAVLATYAGQLLLIKKLLENTRLNLVVEVSEQDQIAMEKMRAIATPKEGAESKEEEETKEAAQPTMVATLRALSSTPLSRCLRISTVDNFQGELSDSRANDALTRRAAQLTQASHSSALMCRFVCAAGQARKRWWCACLLCVATQRAASVS